MANDAFQFFGVLLAYHQVFIQQEQACFYRVQNLGGFAACLIGLRVGIGQAAHEIQHEHDEIQHGHTDGTHLQITNQSRLFVGRGIHGIHNRVAAVVNGYRRTLGRVHRLV